MIHEAWIAENKGKFSKLNVQYTQLKNCSIRGTTWGTVGEWIITTATLRVRFVFDCFHGGCGVGTIYKYSVQTILYYPIKEDKEFEEAKLLINSALSFLANQNKKGAYLACTPMMTLPSYHFLVAGGFIPVIGWGNPLHSGRSLELWIKHFREPMADEHGTPHYEYNFEKDLGQNLIMKKKTLVQALMEENQELKKQLEQKQENTESVKTGS